AFLAERRRLLAAAANAFLEELAGGSDRRSEVGRPVVGDEAQTVTVALEDNESRIVDECRTWVLEHGLAEGIADFDLVDENTGEWLAILDLAWPGGMQSALTEPVALLLNETGDVERLASEHGFRFFTSADALRSYVTVEVLDDAPRGVAVSATP